MTDKDFGGNDNMPSWFGRVPTKAVMDPGITHAELRVLACIACFANNQGFAWPNQSTIKARIKVGQNTIDKAIKKLKKRGHIEIVSRHRSHPKWRRVMGNVYRIIHDEEMQTDKLIDQMNSQDDDPIVEDSLGDPESSAESDQEGDGNQSGPEREEQLVEALMVARAYAEAARKSHGQMRLVNPRAVDAAAKLLSTGIDAASITDQVTPAAAYRGLTQKYFPVSRKRRVLGVWMRWDDGSMEYWDNE